MGQRENKNIIWYLFGWYPWGKWRGWRLFDKNFWNSGYIWEDTFSRPFNRLIGCKLFGHRDVQGIRDDYNKPIQFCFSCARPVTGWITVNCKHCKLMMSHPIDYIDCYVECPHCKIKVVLKNNGIEL